MSAPIPDEPDPVMGELLARASRQLDSLRRVTEGISAIRATAEVENGAVSVTVDGNGGVVAIELSDAVARLDRVRFADLVVEAAATASRDAFAERARVITGFSEEFADLVGRTPEE